MTPSEARLLIACHECDALHERRPLDEGEVAICSRCGARLYARARNDLQRTLAFAVSGLLFFVVMVSFPFLGISANGVEREVSLTGSIAALFEQSSPLLALLVGLVLIAFPLVKVLGLIALLLPLQIGGQLPGSHLYCRIVERVVPWNMTEIYLVGVIVTFVKLSAMANIIYGVAFAAFVAFVIVMTAANATINFTTLWDSLPDQGGRRREPAS